MKVFKCKSAKCKNYGIHFFRLKGPKDGLPHRVLISGHFCDRHLVALVRAYVSKGHARCYIKKTIRLISERRT
jgi:hypothetical protein